LREKILNIINFFESQPSNFFGWAVAFFTLLSLNLFFQFITYDFKTVRTDYFLGALIQPYYFILYLAVVIFLHCLTGEKIKRVANFILWGFWSIIFWPIIDKIILGDKFHLSFYLYGGLSDVWHKFWTFFGTIKPIGILYGTRIETVFIILLTGGYVFYKTKKISKAIFGGLGVYTIFFVSVALPSLLLLLVKGLSGGDVFSVGAVDVVKFFNTPLEYFGVARKGFSTAFFYKISLFYNLIFICLLFGFQYLWDKKVLMALLKNIRLPQMFFNWGLLFSGILIGLYYFPENYTTDVFSGLVIVNLFLSVLLVWLFSVVINDIEDRKVDRLSNTDRPLITKVVSRKEYFNIGMIFLFLSLLLSLTISGKTFLLTFLYILVTTIYSRHPFKLKRIPFVAGLLSAFASLLFFLQGYIIVSDQQSIKYFPWGVVIYLLLVYGLILPIKDLKDIESDRKNDVLTVANLLGEKKARIYFGGIVFLSYCLSIFVFAGGKMMVPAVIIGGISYWIINNEKNKRNKLLYKLLFLAIVFAVLVIFV